MMLDNGYGAQGSGQLKVRVVAPVLLALALFARTPLFAADAAPPHFAVIEYRVLGNTVLPIRDIERAVYPFLGADKTFEDVQKARDALQLAYRANDFGTVFVDIPEQDVGDGVVRLRVTEGRLRVTTISGAKYYSERKLLAELPAAKAGTVPRVGELQKELASVNSQTADRSIVPILKAGPEPGTVDLALKVEDHLPLHGSAELDNQYTVGTTHLRANVGLDYANLFDALDDISVQYQTSPEKTSQVGVLAAGYTSGPMAGGVRASLTYIHSSSSVPTVGALGVLGKGDIFSGRITFPLAFSAESTQSAFLGADYKHFLESINVDAVTSLVTPISYMNFSVGYSGDWRHETRQWSFFTSANFGIKGVVNDVTSFEDKRYLAPPGYFYLREDASFTQTIVGGVRLRLRLAGQFTGDPLVSNENFAISGFDGVRGYLEAEELGDSALKGTFQIDSPAVVVRSVGGRVFAFYDAGRTKVVDALPGQADHALLRSFGGGLSLVGGTWLNSSVTWAYPISNSTATRQGESRVLFTVRGAF